jgi:hypothetical protein
MSIEVNIAVQINRISVAQMLIDSLNRQTVKPDLITVILQGFDYIFKSAIEINYVRNTTNKGAAERIKNCGDYINLIIDDDFIASPKYIQTALDGLRRNPNAIGSFWGFKYLNNQDYRKGWADLESWTNFDKDVKCHRLGLGLSIWNEQVLNLRHIEFDRVNYNDMQMAVHCAKNGIDMFLLAHPNDICHHIGDEKIQENALWKDEVNHMLYLQSKHKELIELI